MASWCGSTLSFCKKQETQGKRRLGESIPTGTQKLEKGIGGYGKMAGRRMNESQGLWKGSGQRGLWFLFWIDWWKDKWHLQHIVEEFLSMAMALKWLMDVKIQNAKWFYLIVSLTIILRGEEQISFRTDIIAASQLPALLFSEAKVCELSASSNTHQYKEFLVSNFEEANNGSFSSPAGCKE